MIYIKIQKSTAFSVSMVRNLFNCMPKFDFETVITLLS